MRNTMFISTSAFFVFYLILRGPLGNDGLWIAFLIFLTLRGLVMFLMQKKQVFEFDH